MVQNHIIEAVFSENAEIYFVVDSDADDNTHPQFSL